MNIYFVGGSITEGVGASNVSNSYAKLISDYLKSTYKQIKIINLGAGGTASHFGVFRIAQHFEKQSPDVVFLEFAVNDRIYSLEDIKVYYENLICQVYRWNKNCNIISIEAPTGLCDACASIHADIAGYYNIPVIDVQAKVWKEINENQYSWQDISIDNIHPNDKGHKIYAEKIIEQLKNIDVLSMVQFPEKEPITQVIFKHPRIKSYEECTFFGNWLEREVNLNNKVNMVAVNENIGECVEVNFKGKYLSILTILSRNAGMLECILDYKYTFNLDLYMEHEGYFNFEVNTKDLSEGSHNLLMKISNQNNSKSLGHEIVIGGFLVDEG